MINYGPGYLKAVNQVIFFNSLKYLKSSFNPQIIFDLILNRFKSIITFNLNLTTKKQTVNKLIIDRDSGEHTQNAISFTRK